MISALDALFVLVSALFLASRREVMSSQKRLMTLLGKGEERLA